MRLQDKLALVTGGGAGIGKGIALCLAEQGAHVVIVDIDETAARDVAAEITALGRRALAVRADVSRKQDIEAAIRQAGEMGRLGILVNNAGVEYLTPALEVDEAEWDRVLTINLKGTFLCAQECARLMAADAGGGKIINIGSIAAMSPPRREPHYAASKAAIHALTKQLALELAPHRINVNAVAPGVIRNGLSTHHCLADAEQAEMVRQRIPWQRAGTPRDVGRAVVFLASDEADYITGVVLTVDGGLLLTAL